VEQLGEGLAQLGYALEPTEVARLLEQMQQDDGFVGKSGFLASQIDWTAFQVDFRCVRSRVQAGLGFKYSNKSGFLASQIDWTAFQVDFRCSIAHLL
jgi:hypothetical protein